MHRHLLSVSALLALAAVAPGPAAAQQDTAAASDTTLLGHAARMAREKHARIVGPAGATDPGTALYRGAQTDMAALAWGDAALSLTAALSRAPRNALYRGELAFIIARSGNLDSAATLYQQAWSLEQANPWYLVGLSVVRAAQGRWADAAGTITVAVQADSAVADGRITATAVAYFLQANDRAQALEWARLAVQRAPEDAVSWYLIAVSYAERGDTAGLAPARRYRTLRPAEPQGALVLAHMLFLAGKSDSAIALVEQVAPDTNYRDAVAGVYLRVGERLLRQREVDTALAVLARGQAVGSATLRAQYAFYVGSAQLVKLSRVLPDVEERRDCAMATAAESLAVSAGNNLRDGASADSARAAMFLSEILPGQQRSAQNFRESFCRPRQPARPRRP